MLMSWRHVTYPWPSNRARDSLQQPVVEALGVDLQQVEVFDSVTAEQGRERRGLNQLGGDVLGLDGGEHVDRVSDHPGHVAVLGVGA